MDQLLQVIESVIRFIVKEDYQFGLLIDSYLKAYSFPTNQPSFLAGNIITFVKLSCYSFVLLIPLSILKLLRRENKIIFILFSISFIVFAISAFLIFLSFLQLLFT